GSAGGGDDQRNRTAREGGTVAHVYPDGGAVAAGLLYTAGEAEGRRRADRGGGERAADLCLRQRGRAQCRRARRTPESGGDGGQLVHGASEGGICTPGEGGYGGHGGGSRGGRPGSVRDYRDEFGDRALRGEFADGAQPGRSRLRTAVHCADRQALCAGELGIIVVDRRGRGEPR